MLSMASPSASDAVNFDSDDARKGQPYATRFLSSLGCLRLRPRCLVVLLVDLFVCATQLHFFGSQFFTLMAHCVAQETPLRVGGVFPNAWQHV